MNRSQTDLFSGEHAALEPPVVPPVAVDQEMLDLSARLPQHLRLGTSSWSFPGWEGVVYGARASEALLARKGLEPYARHPLLRAVGVDRTYYEPIPATTFQEYADLVPADFRFVVKADRRLTIPYLAGPDHPFGAPPPPGERIERARARGGIHATNPLFLDASYAHREVVEPALAGLGSKLGTILFQFPPLDPGHVGGAGGFAGKLRQFLAALPTGVDYAVEIRTPSLLSRAYRDALHGTGALHTFTVHPTMPTIRQQRASVPWPQEGPLLIRWMLGHGLSYESARTRYAPFSDLAAEDVTSRRWIASMVVEALQEERSVTVIVNNKAEGCSPRSVFKLGRMIGNELST